MVRLLEDAGLYPWGCILGLWGSFGQDVGRAGCLAPSNGHIGVHGALTFIRGTTQDPARLTSTRPG